MLTAYKSRDMRIADLEVHGWEPVVNRGTGRHGVYHEASGVGFSARKNPIDAEPVRRVDRDRRVNSYDSCPWGEVTDWHLDIIDERMRQV